MNSNQFIQYSKNYTSIVAEDVKELEAIVQNFPFFQSARALYLKGLYNMDSYKYNFELKKTAAITTERGVLFDFITSKEFNIQQNNAVNINEINVFEVEIVRFLPPKEEIQMIHENIDEIFKENTSTNTLNNANIIENSEKSLIKNDETILINELENHILEENTKENLVLKSNNEDKNDIFDDNFFKKSAIFEIDQDTFSEGTIENNVIKEDKELEAPFIINFEPIAEKLQIGKPLSFEVNEKHSFFEWLKIAQIKPIQRSENSSGEEEKNDFEVEINLDVLEKDKEKLKKNALIEQFLATNPKIIPVKNILNTLPKITQTFEKQHLMTETLARVYIEQKKYDKAIQAFQILILKNPEKSVYFADRIKDIKILQQNNI